MNKKLMKWINSLREFVYFAYKLLTSFFSAFRYGSETMKQIYIMGIQAMPVVLLASVFVSMVLALEWGKKLEPMGAKLMLGRIVGISVIREIGPMVTGLMVAGRTGAKIAAEIGNMVLSEQVDALRAFGTDPIKRLIAPRLFASTLVMIPLIILADTLGIIAGWFASVAWLNVDTNFFFQSLRDGLFIKDLTIGIVKPPFFGWLIGLLGSYYGYTVTGGAEGMGRTVTTTVTYASLGVLIMDFLLTKVILTFF